MRRALGVLGAALLLPGCRGAEAPRVEAPLAKVRFVWRPTVSNAPILIAVEEGYFRKHGLDVEFLELGRNQDGLPSLIEGKLDVISGSINPAYLNAIARGADVRLVAELGHLDPGGCTYAALVARKGLLKDGRLRTPGGTNKWRIDLRPGSMSEFILDKALARDGIPADRVKIDFVPANAEIQALRNGAIDVTLSLGSRLPQVLAEGSGEVWHSAESLAPGFSYLSIVYGPSLLRKDPESGRRLMAGYLEGVRQYNEGKTERNVQILQKRLRLDRQTVLDTCWIPIGPEARIDVEKLLEFQTWALGKGLLDRALAVDEFSDPRFSEAAVRSLGSRPEGH